MNKDFETKVKDYQEKIVEMERAKKEAIEEADALLPEYMRLGVAVEWLREFVREHKIEKETTREVSLKMSAALAEGAELALSGRCSAQAAAPRRARRELTANCRSNRPRGDLRCAKVDDFGMSEHIAALRVVAVPQRATAQGDSRRHS